MLTAAFSDWTSITGEGYRANELQRIKYLADFLTTVERDSKAWIGLTNQKTDLQIGMWAGFKSIAEAGTITEGVELDKRAVLDTDFLDKIQRNAGRRLANASDSIKKESGLIKKFFDWESIAASERTLKLISSRAKQYAEESRLFDVYLRDMVAGEERMLQVREGMDMNELEMSNRIHTENVRLAEEGTKERIDLGKFYLDNISRQMQQEFDFKKDLTEMSQRETTAYLESGMDSVKSIYDDFKPFFQQYNLDLVKLDTWRADQMLAIEKKLSKAKADEIGKVYESYAEHLRETEKFWMADKGFKIPLSTPLGLGPGAYDLSGSLTKLGIELAKAEGHLGGTAKAEDKMTAATAALTDELAGHSLTTAIDEVRKSMEGMDAGLREVISDMTGFDQKIEESQKRSVELEGAYSDQVYGIFADFMTGKEKFAENSYRSLLAAQRDYADDSLSLEAEYAREFSDIQALYGRGAVLQKGLGRFGYLPLEPQVVPTTEQPVLPTIPSERPYAPTRELPGMPGTTELHFHIENLYGADEAFLNSFAEDIARRIRGQNITI